MKVKEESEKVGLKVNIQKTEIMASSPIISWQIDGETIETVTSFISLGSKISADCDCSHEIKRCLILGRKGMTNLDSILKTRGIILLTMVHLVKAMIFPIVIHGCDSWTIKKADSQRIGAFELWCWRRLLRVPWIARRSNQSILKISPGCSLEGLMLKLKLQYFGHLMWRADSLEKTLIPGKIEGRRRRGQQRMRWLDGSPPQWWCEFEQAPEDGEGQGSLACCSPWGCKELDMTGWLNKLIYSQVFSPALLTCFSMTQDLFGQLVQKSSSSSSYYISILHKGKEIKETRDKTYCSIGIHYSYSIDLNSAITTHKEN